MQKGGLDYGSLGENLFGASVYLYGAEYDPVGDKGGKLDKAIQEARPYLSIVNLAGRVISGVAFTRVIPFFGSPANYIQLSINARSRRLLVEKLNSSLVIPDNLSDDKKRDYIRDNKINYYHIWKDVSADNTLVVSEYAVMSYRTNRWTRQKIAYPSFTIDNNYASKNSNLRDNHQLKNIDSLTFDFSILRKPEKLTYENREEKPDQWRDDAFRNWVEDHPGQKPKNEYVQEWMTNNPDHPATKNWNASYNDNNKALLENGGKRRNKRKSKKSKRTKRRRTRRHSR